MLDRGFNALLKTLEEPTENVVFILATTELHKIPATILSVSSVLSLSLSRRRTLLVILSGFWSRNVLTLSKKVCRLIARRAEGGMRDALVYPRSGS